MARCLALVACGLLFSAEGQVSVGGSGGVSVGGSAGGSASGAGSGGVSVGGSAGGSASGSGSAGGRWKTLLSGWGCKEASCLEKARQGLEASLSAKEQATLKLFLNHLAVEVEKDKGREGMKECTAGNRTQEEKRACFQAAGEALGAAALPLLGGSRTAEVKAKVQKELAKEAAREALGEVYAGCLVTAVGARASCLAQIKGDLAVAGLEGESPRNIRDGLFSRKMKEEREPGEDCNSTCREAAKQAAEDAGMEKRQYASLKALADIRAAAEVYSNCRLSGGESSGESECMAMARTDFVASSGARAEDFSLELQARVRALGEAMINGVPVVMARLKRVVATVVADSSAGAGAAAGAASGSCDAKISDWFARTCLSRAKANESRAESAAPRKCVVVDGKVQYSALVKVNVAEEEMEALSAHVASSFQGQALVAARRLGDGRRLSTASESYASQDVAECPETDSACREGSTESTETSSTPKPSSSSTPKPSEPVAAAAGARLAALAALAALATALAL